MRQKPKYYYISYGIINNSLGTFTHSSCKYNTKGKTMSVSNFLNGLEKKYNNKNYKFIILSMIEINENDYNNLK